VSLQSKWGNEKQREMVRVIIKKREREAMSCHDTYYFTNAETFNHCFILIIVLHFLTFHFLAIKANHAQKIMQERVSDIHVHNFL